MPKASINHLLAGTLVAGGLTADEAAKQCGAKNGASLRRVMYRKGVTVKGARTVTGEQMVTRSMTMRLASAAGQVLKDSMAGVLQAHTDALAQVPAKANLGHIIAVGAALEPLVRSAKVVHGWGDETVQGLIVDMRQADPDSVNVVTDIDTTVTPMVTEQAACGVDTTTCSVPDSTSVEQTPQV